MHRSNGVKTHDRKFLTYLMNPRNWWLPLTIIVVLSFAGVGMIGYQTYNDAPPFEQFKSPVGDVVSAKENVVKGQEVFHKYALMEYGSMFGDGAQRGPDYTAEALHLSTQYMNEYYIKKFIDENDTEPNADQIRLFNEKVQAEWKVNRYNEEEKAIYLSDAQLYAFEKLRVFYQDYFLVKEPDGLFPEPGYINDAEEISALSDFFFWGAWVCVVQRPGKDFSYTHNWPFDMEAGNTPTSPVIFWSVIGILGFVLGLGIVLYYLGQFDSLSASINSDGTTTYLTIDRIKNLNPSPSQKATYKFFAVAALLFFLQIVCGFITINEFTNFLGFVGIKTSNTLPVTITRSWHLMLALYWISACWIASSIFVLPIIAKREVPGQKTLINILFSLVFILVVGSLVGIYMGPMGLLDNLWRLLGHQGWEFVDFGRVYQGLLMVVFVLWAVIVYRGLKPILVNRQKWNLPNWIIYSVIGIPLLFLSGFVAKPETSFVIADFWRWMVIHMWVEAFFEVFITVIVSYLMVLMGLVSRSAAVRVVYLATILFLGTGLMGISHNFYWNAKPVATMALGSVFSTLQIVPLIILTVEAWRFKNLPGSLGSNKGKSLFGLPDVFLFLIAVNFWNFFGAGVLGLIINLPIINYYEHGSYLTVNHGHAAMMGVYGNISIAAMLFAGKLMVKSERWNPLLVRTSFWSINIGLMLMVVLDLFPAGALQLKTIMDYGFWYGRSDAFITGTTFESLTWMRAIGASLFLLGGVIPLAWLLVSRWGSIKSTSNPTFEITENIPVKKTPLPIKELVTD